MPFSNHKHLFEEVFIIAIPNDCSWALFPLSQKLQWLVERGECPCFVDLNIFYKPHLHQLVVLLRIKVSFQVRLTKCQLLVPRYLLQFLQLVHDLGSLQVLQLLQLLLFLLFLLLNQTEKGLSVILFLPYLSQDGPWLMQKAMDCQVSDPSILTLWGSLLHLYTL